MEAAALYAFGEAKEKKLVCFAYVTNQMGTTEGDFKKESDDGIATILRVITLATSHVSYDS